MGETLWKILLKSKKPDFFFCKNLSILKKQWLGIREFNRRPEEVA